jgi:hypothetical protein
LFVDGKGVSYHQYRRHLPARARDFPDPERVDDPERTMRYREQMGRCQITGDRAGPIDVHHIIGGTKGRSDEWTNLILLRRDWHEKANTNELSLGVILWLKWSTDREHTDWVRLAILRRAFLPTLIIDDTTLRTAMGF